MPSRVPMLLVLGATLATLLASAAAIWMSGVRARTARTPALHARPALAHTPTAVPAARAALPVEVAIEAEPLHSDAGAAPPRH